jgi:uncharacterized protein (TIGR00369 family)
MMTNSPDTLSQWLTTESAIRANWTERKPLPRSAMATMTGLALFEAMLNGELPGAPIADTLDFLLVEAAHGRAVFQGQPTPKVLNPLGGVHGGWYATLLDSCMACSVHTTLPAGRAYTTTEFSVHLVRAIPPDVQRVRAIGQVLHAGRQLATAEGKLVGPDGRLYAHGTTSCLVFDLPGEKTS